MELNIKGKVALVGGSSKGLGKACAIALAKEGVNVVLCARNEKALLQTKTEIESLGVEVLALSIDMTSAEDNQRIIDETIRKFGRIDILVNNSGGPKPGTFRDISPDDLDNAYNSVLKYNIRMIQGCLPYMEKNEWGRIVNITSITVKEPAPNMLLSNIFRSAVVSFAKASTRTYHERDYNKQRGSRIFQNRSRNAINESPLSSRRHFGRRIRAKSHSEFSAQTLYGSA